MKSDWFFWALLIVCLPLAVASHFLFPGAATFVFSALALVPLARILGQGTESIASRLGAGWGALLNATMGNAAELIVALVALSAGHVQVVKASITGSVLGNLLLVLGAAILAGGIRREKQTFNATAALSSAAILFLAVTALLVPHIFHLSGHPGADRQLPLLSLVVSGILLVVYGLSLLFAFKTHAHLYRGAAQAGHAEPLWSISKSLVVLVLSTVGVAIASELLVGAIEPAVERFGFTHTFVGVVIIAVVGNAAEHWTAIAVALKDKMDLAFNIAFESSKQIALFVAPILVFAGALMHRELTLNFTHMEVAGVTIGVAASALIAVDGESNWLEGAMLLGTYAIFAVAFFFTP